MLLSEYQVAAKATAIYPQEYVLTYPALGLVGEIGEVANKVKKIIRDMKSVITSDKAEQIEGEVGDVLWYCAAVANDLGLVLNEFGSLPPKYLPSLPECGLKLAAMGGRVAEIAPYTGTHHGEFAKGKLSELLPQVCTYLSAILCHMPERKRLGDIGKANLEKLLSRKERGTLQGDGDNR